MTYCLACMSGYHNETFQKIRYLSVRKRMKKYNIKQNLCNNVNSLDACNEIGAIMSKSLAQDKVTKIENYSYSMFI